MSQHSKLNELSPHPVMLAPMVGLTHYAVRSAIAEFLPNNAKVLWPTEMLSSRRLPSMKIHQTSEVFFYDIENGICPQILANEEIFIRDSIAKLEEWGVRAIDINMGCPVKKALQHNYGVALMGDPAYAKQVVQMAVGHSKLPISVKLRAGLDKQDFEYLCNFITGLFEAGAQWITIHPRTAEQKRRGIANWNLIKQLKDYFRVYKPEFESRPIIGNGDIQTYEDIQKMFEEYECDRVMIGRAMLAKPWLIQNKPEPDAYTQGEWCGNFLKKVLEKMIEHYPESIGVRKYEFIISNVTPWLEFGQTLTQKVNSAKNYSNIQKGLDDFFNQKQKVMKYTMLKN